MRTARSKRSRIFRPAFEVLENRCLMAFSVTTADLFSQSGLRLVADFDQPVNAASVQANDLVINGTQTATSVSVLDADTVEFLLPALAAGTHVATISANAIVDSTGTGLSAFSNSYIVASNAQWTVKHNPRLQPGNAPLAGFAGGDKDRVDIMWQTIPGGSGTQDSFAVQYRLAGSNAAWQSATLNAEITTGVENRVVRSASITNLDWKTSYEYRVRHLRGSVIVATYQHTFETRLQAGDATSFSFAAYGDSASGTASGFRQVQSRINQVDPAFTVLLGDNVYSVGSHQESDARFDPVINPEAAAWMASHIDYLGLGNHDVSTSSGLPSEQNYSVPIPVAGVTAPVAPPTSERNEHNFSWDYGNVHFVTFDTNSLADSVRLDALLNWVVADLTASTARWKIVYGHHPLAGVPDKTENPSQNYYQQVVNRLKAAGVDLFMTGHSHTYSWTYPLTGQINGTATYVDHGHDDHFFASEGLTQLVSGVGGVEIRTGTYSQFPFVATGFTSATAIPARFGFSKVDVTPNSLTVSYVAADNGAVIDTFTIAKDDSPQTVSFQQGANGYSGTTDTYLHQNTPTTDFSASASLKVDNDDPAGSGLDAQTLLRFDNLFGNGAGQIPQNATLRSATLQLQVTNGSIHNMNLHRMLQSWNVTDNWNTRINGVQTDNVEAVATPDTSSGQTQIGSMSFNVLSSLQAWQADPSKNLGWAMIPTGTDGVDFHSSEGATKPKLIVTYIINNGPNDPPVAVNDLATATSNTATTISVLNNDSDANGNPLTVTSVTAPSHGSAVINGGNSVTYTSASGYFGPDSFSYTISDGQGGTATASVNVTVVASASFQQGVNGYTGSVDTFLQQNASTTNNAAATSLNVDTDDPPGSGLDVQTLMRFDNLFGNGADQIPTNATLKSATLQLQVTNAGASMNLHRMLSNWSSSDTWSSTNNGIQNDGVEAVSTTDVSSGAVSVGTLLLNVLPSLQAWQTTPATNLGWVFLPTGTDGVDFDSSEGTTKPKLVVTYLPASNTPPTSVNDSATTSEDTSVEIAVLANDSDADGDTLSVASTGSPLHGTATVNANGTITYTPFANYFGADSFTYSLSDGRGGTATGTVSVSITGVNDLPTGQPTISGVAQVGQVLSAITTGIDDADGLGTFAYQWLRGGAAILGATSSSYLLLDADLGATVQVRVSYVDGNGTSEQLTSAGVVVQAQPGILVSKTSLTTMENGTAATFEVSLATTPDFEVRIAVSSSDLTEGLLDRSEIVFPAGSRGPITVSVTPVDDLLAGSLDGSVVYTIVTGTAVSSDTNYSGRNASDVTVTNQDDDIPVVLRSYADSSYTGGAVQGTVTGVITDTWQTGLGLQTLKEVSGQVVGGKKPKYGSILDYRWMFPNQSQATTFHVDARQSAGADDNFRFEYSTNSGTNWSVLGTINQTASYQNLTVSVPSVSGNVLVRVVDTDRTAASTTSSPLLDSVSVDYLYFEKTQEDLRPVVTITSVDALAAEVGADPGKYRITRPQASSSPLEVTFTIQGTATSGIDYVPLNTRATIPAGATYVDVTLTPIDDLLTEGVETVVLTLVDGLLYKGATNGSATVTIADDELVLFKATSEIVGSGTVSGDYTRTWEADSNVQSITEVLSAGSTNSSRYSFLQRTWVFNATSTAKSIFLKASTTSTIDSFAFSYSTNGSTFTNFATLGPGGSANQRYAIPNLTGTVYVRVLDTNRVLGETKLETVSIDQVYLSTASPQTASTVGKGYSGQDLTLAQAQPIMATAASIWQSAGYAPTALSSISLKIADLGGSTLALAAGRTIWLDDNAAGWGWYVEPQFDRVNAKRVSSNPVPRNRMDLLTVVLHEMGHVLGLDHDDHGVMADTLSAGVRRTGIGQAEISSVDQVLKLAGSQTNVEGLGAWLNAPFDSMQRRTKRR